MSEISDKVFQLYIDGEGLPNIQQKMKISRQRVFQHLDKAGFKRTERARLYAARAKVSYNRKRRVAAIGNIRKDGPLWHLRREFEGMIGLKTSKEKNHFRHGHYITLRNRCQRAGVSLEIDYCDFLALVAPYYANCRAIAGRENYFSVWLKDSNSSVLDFDNARVICRPIIRRSK